MAGTSPPARAEGSLWRCIPAPFLPGLKPASRERPVQQLGRAPKIEQRLKQLIRRIELTDAGGWYDGEIRETCPAFTTTRYLALGAAGSAIREERRTQSFASLQKISTAT